ncbi:component of SufBCD complex [Pseudotabrizicola sp.]|uniref:component of SufBCD complex n=2 Tax=Pseudotabrizicola sp. TaxID=2939647 RepID=UPI00271896A4|nr:component of SufBCD complex [Pseudotabrizicola sp.]MDO8882158.1 component of SufBCD complex [Pseudotabrizicola sp.]MDP2082673.1 component of SufBCD complex [Pseudotabrizicola sp.]
MEWYSLIFLLIDMRSFSSLWYWIFLAVLWSSVSHWVLGVPFDLITRARRQGAEAAEDLAVVVQINARRMLYISRNGGLWVIGFVFFLLTVLGMLAILYQIELAQAVLLMFAPMVLVAYLTLRLALRVETDAPEGAVLVRLLMRHRFLVQLIGMISIFVTALFGMYQNMT